MTVQNGQNEWLDLESYSDNPIFNTKAVVQQTSVPAPTLRAWERRYDILSPERGNNDYRLYSERDIVTIQWLKERVDAGMSISQAIALFRHIKEEHQRLQKEQSSSAASTSTFYIALPEVAQERLTTEAMERNQPGSDATEEWTPTNTEQKGNYRASYNLRTIREQLLEAFKKLDESTASMLVASVLSIYSVEQICADLIVPTMWQIGKLWEEGTITVSVEHFASGFFRGVLTNLLHVTPFSNAGPLVIVCCAPGESHELAALMLALFLRRTGIRVAYLGQSIETAGLLQTIKQMSPALICVSLSIPAYLSTLIDLARQIQAMPAPRPLFAFGGQVFAHHTHLISQVPGIYLGGDLKKSIVQLQRMIVERDL
ncbi:MAG: cobalamin B12-binding domain-containing protein [Chloroflexota bacterium]|nr:cobalamin B12-binding domain-containing protein [Chloroflexota bacterium]